MSAQPVDPGWYEVTNIGDVPSPALLVYPDRVERNIRRAIEIAGGAQRLWPHVKTHKLAEIVRMHVALGVRQFKCATIAEAEMTAGAGAQSVLLAYQPVGPNIARVLALTRRFPQVRFMVVADDRGIIESIGKVFHEASTTLNVLLDVDCGMGRTGASVEKAPELYRALSSTAGIRAAGLHAYDGHIHDSDLETRRRRTAEFSQRLAEVRTAIERTGTKIPPMVVGGTPTFPIHAAETAVECSPGTYVFWDFGYAESMPDLPFEIAAVLLTRVVSKPRPNRLCLDLGHKAVASENPPPRVKFLNLPEATAVMHSEEHLVMETPRAAEFRVGDVLYGVPRHICPTVALHGEAVVVRNARAEERWKVVARDRALTI